MSDLVARLRANVTYTYMPMAVRQQLAEAADMIESLSAEVAAIRVERDALEDRLEDVLSPEVTDVEIEDALTSEGIYVWGPDGERFERMFAIVMKSRSKSIDSVGVLAGEGCDG